MCRIDFPRTDIGGVVMLDAQQSFNKGFFAGTVLPHLFQDRGLIRSNLTARGTFLDVNRAPGPVRLLVIRISETIS
jgi:hypothetical protein